MGVEPTSEGSTPTHTVLKTGEATGPHPPPTRRGECSIGPRGLRSARRGLLEPAGPTLGEEAIATADAVIVPGLAVGRDGTRLGRGGGSYDRALARVPVGTFVCVLLNSEELLDRVPQADHDRTVTAAAIETGIVRFSPAG